MTEQTYTAEQYEELCQALMNIPIANIDDVGLILSAVVKLRQAAQMMREREASIDVSTHAFWDKQRQPVKVTGAKTLPIDVRGKWHEVPIPVHLHIIALRDRLEQAEKDEALIRVYDAVSRSGITRDVKTPETKARIVREAMLAAAPEVTK